MSVPPPPGDSRDREGRLERCIRDLAALNALPSMCVGRDPDAALAIALDALPTALSCDLVYVSLPGAPPKERGSLRGLAMTASQLAEMSLVTTTDADGADVQIFLSGGKLSCLEAEVPLGAERGRLVAGRSTPLDPETDRVLVRTAANVVGVAIETANVLEAARRKDDFLAVLGHELRNPLAPILAAVELLARNQSAARERSVIERHTRHLARLVDDLLDISRVTHGHFELRSEEVSLGAVLEGALEIAAPLVSRYGHSLQRDGADDIALRGDPMRLAQVFGNLLTNAAKFTPQGGRIEVLVEPSAGRVRVSVRDNGRGIARDQLSRIFEPFVQAEQERDALGGGLGLGLAIVRNLVERHGGVIFVQSDGRDHGATFTVELPTIVRTEKPNAPARPPTPAARAGVRVLIVDDNVDVAELLSEALHYEGFNTATANDGHSALDRWLTFLPHAGVLDVGLPGLDGYELAKTLRAQHGRGATLIAATGYGQPRDRLRAIDAGFDCHLVKPVSVNDLVSILDRHIIDRTGQPEPQ
jgi:signal transduction histidine kinase/ActR/RegA family two-component response regulator